MYSQHIVFVGTNCEGMTKYYFYNKIEVGTHIEHAVLFSIKSDLMCVYYKYIFSFVKLWTLRGEEEDSCTVHVCFQQCVGQMIYHFSFRDFKISFL